MSQRAIVRIVVAVALIGLTGCAWLEPPLEPTVTDGGVSGQGGSESSFDRAAVSGAASETRTCGSGQTVVSNADDGVRLEGDCGSVRVSGDMSIVTADHIGTLVVEGYGHVVLTGSVDSVTLTADAYGSVVEWETGDPEVTNHAADSVARPASR